MPTGTSYTIVGREGSGKRALAACILGDLRPDGGRVAVLGVDPRRERRALRRRLRFSEADGELQLDTSPPTRITLTDDPLRARESDGVGFLKDGRLVEAGPRDDLLRRFRRIRYVNEVTPERTEYGTELDLFDAVRVRVRGWGVDAIVSNFTDEAFAKFRSTEGVRDARAEPLDIAAVFEALVGRAGAV